MSDKTLSASATGASYLILLQVLSRALTFTLNQILLRFLSPELLGASAQLELYSISILFFARESIRVAAQRQRQGAQTVVNLSYLAIAAGPPLAWAFAWLWLRSDAPGVRHFGYSLGVYAVAAVVELLSEPAFVVTQQKLLYRIRASAEGSATVAKGLATVGATAWASRRGVDAGVLPFALGQITFASVMLFVYVVRVRQSGIEETFSLLPARLAADQAQQPYLGLFPKRLANLSVSLTLQSTLKYFLTQSDGLIIATYASLADQGAYALASNYGGLVARMLFQPIEEAGRTLFARLCASADAPDASQESIPTKGTDDRSESAATAEARHAASILGTILHLYSILSLLALSLGPTLAPILLTLVAGRRWSLTSAPDVLAAYCYYIPLLAFNGILEAFVSAVASPADLRGQSVWMTAFSVVFAGTAYLLLGVYGWGAKGVVAANCVNMGLRVVWGASFITGWFRGRGVPFGMLDATPAGLGVAAAVLAYAALTGPMSIGPKVDDPLWMQLGKAGAVGGGLGLIILVVERAFFAQCYRMLRPNK